jgi:formylglycine-generating enzyme required for sulfatase activity
MRAFLNIGVVIGLALTTLAGAGLAELAPPPGMAMVPPGRYAPLFRSEKDPKEVPVGAFLMDVVPVTNADYLEFVKANPKSRR